MTVSHKLHSFHAADDWIINGALYDIYDDPLNPTGYTIEWNLIDWNQEVKVSTAQVAITIADAPSGQIKIIVPSEITQTLEPGEYTDALRLTKGTATGTMWYGQILVKPSLFGAAPAVQNSIDESDRFGVRAQMEEMRRARP